MRNKPTKKQIVLKLPNGFFIKENTYEKNIDEAVVILSSKKQNKCTKVYRELNSSTARIVTHSLVCPHCGKTVPAYCRYFKTGVKSNIMPTEKIPRDVIKDWGSKQLSFFENYPEKMELNKVFSPAGTYKCEHCGYTSPKLTGEREVFIEYADSYVKVSCEIMGVDEILSLPWLNCHKVTVSLPLYETVTFNMKAGRTYVELGGRNRKNTVAKRDVTRNPDILAAGVLDSLMKRNVIFSRALKNVFVKAGVSRDCFDGKKITPENLVLFTRFCGYDSSFYDAVPFKDTGYDIDSSFRNVEDKLRNSQKGIKYYEESSLPKVKSARKIFYSNPGLLFYLEEAEMIWSIVGDINHFCRLMNSKRIFSILSDLRKKPGIALLLGDYKKVKGNRVLVERMLLFWEKIEFFAGRYALMSDEMRARIRCGWKENGGSFTVKETVSDFSVPHAMPKKKIYDCEINGYFFTLLRNGRDYLAASRELNNCLCEWDVWGNPVVAVKEEGKTVASIELKGDVVVQIRGVDNSPIDNVIGLREAYGLWLKKMGLKENLKYDDEDYDDFLDIDDLPF